MKMRKWKVLDQTSVLELMNNRNSLGERETRVCREVGWRCARSSKPSLPSHLSIANYERVFEAELRYTIFLHHETYSYLDNVSRLAVWRNASSG
jgi:hypothetical protein